MARRLVLARPGRTLSDRALGVAYQLDSKTVIRTGGAIYYQPLREDGNADNGIQGFRRNLRRHRQLPLERDFVPDQERRHCVRHARSRT